jgi:predicted nucleic acid-binding protein
MNIVFDTNIIIDVVAKREPFVANSAAVMKMAEQKVFAAAMTANTVTDVYYILQKYLPDRNAVTKALLNIIEVLDVLEITRQRCLDAFNLPITDYEDALLAECARQWGAEYIITRNVQDFANSPVKAITPDGFLSTNIDTH